MSIVRKRMRLHRNWRMSGFAVLGAERTSKVNIGTSPPERDQSVGCSVMLRKDGRVARRRLPSSLTTARNGEAMTATSGCPSDISTALQNVTQEIRQAQVLLTSEKDIDLRVLTDFRDAVNRVRNTAWAVAQYAHSKEAEADPRAFLSLLAGERIRVAYQLCRLVQADMENSEITFQKGQLLQLRDATGELLSHLSQALGE